MKMNKKLLVVVAVGILALAVVNAGLLTYYGQVTANIEVTQPIRVTGNLEHVLEDMWAGETHTENHITIWNEADFSIPVLILNDAPDGINVIYDIRCNTNITCIDGLMGDYTVNVPAKINEIPGKAYVDITYELDSLLETGNYIITTTISDGEELIAPDHL